MSSIHRPLRGDVLVYRHDATERMIDAQLLAQHGRSGRTLVKTGAMRVVIMALGPGGDLPAHGTAGPRTIQVVEGSVECVVGDHAFRLRAGDVIALGPGVRHSARSEGGAVLLLTLVHRRHATHSSRRDRARAARRLSAEKAARQWEDDGGSQGAR